MTLPNAVVDAVRQLQASEGDLTGTVAQAALGVLVAHVDKHDANVAWKAEQKARREEREGPKPKRSIQSRRKPDPPELVEGKRVVMERSGGRCEVEWAVGCTGLHEVTHHKRGRLTAEDHHPDMLVGCCGPCHRHIHAHPDQAEALGLLLSRLGTVRP